MLGSTQPPPMACPDASSPTAYERIVGYVKALSCCRGKNGHWCDIKRLRSEPNSYSHTPKFNLVVFWHPVNSNFHDSSVGWNIHYVAVVWQSWLFHHSLVWLYWLVFIIDLKVVWVNNQPWKLLIASGIVEKEKHSHCQLLLHIAIAKSQAQTIT